jgi:hypothetical protein
MCSSKIDGDAVPTHQQATRLTIQRYRFSAGRATAFKY